MKLKKLDVRGVAHEFMIVGVLVIFSIVGIGYMVAGNANPAGAKAASGATQVSSGSSRTITVDGIQLSCQMGGYSSSLTKGETIKPYVKVTNVGSKTLKTTYERSLSYFDWDRAYVKEKGPVKKPITIKKGATKTINLSPLKVPYASAKRDGSIEVHYWLKIGDSYCGTEWLKFPKNPKMTKEPKPLKPISGGGEG